MSSVQSSATQFSCKLSRQEKVEATIQHIQNLHSNNPSKGARQKLLSGFFSVRGIPPTPLTENHFAKKPLAERGGTPPP